MIKLAKTYDEVVALLNSKGFSSLSLEDKKILKEHQPEEEKMVDTDNYTDIQTKSIKDRQEKGDNLSPEEKTVLVGKDLDEKNKLVDVIVKGQNDLFTHSYNYKEEGVSFDVAIKMPNAMEQGAILAKVQQYLVGTASTWDDYTRGCYYAIALLQVCGKKVPDMFKDPDNIYPVTFDWLYQIYLDFDEFAGRFRY